MSVFDRQSEFNSPALNQLIEEFHLDAPRTCTGCGCTDANACLDELTGACCHWVEPDLCSACFFEQNYSGPESEDSPLVDLVTEAEASAFLRARRAGGGL